MYCDVILFDIENDTKLWSLAGGSNMNSNCPYINCFVYK